MADDLLADFVAAEREHGFGTYGICVQRAGEPVTEHRFRSDDRVNLYSVSKTFTSVAVGMAEAEGRLSLDDRFLDHMPELRPVAADGFAGVTLRHLLTMTSGTGHKWFAVDRIDAADLLHEIVAAPLVAEPGTRFAYTGSGPYAVGRVLARVTGAGLHAYLTPRLFEPLGLHNPAWHTCPLGYAFAESDLYLKTGELARFASLLLDGGRWNGEQLVPAGYVERMPAESVDTSEVTWGRRYSDGYGLGVWLGRDGVYLAAGSYGQYVVVCPRRRVAVTVTAHSEGEREHDLLDAVFERVIDR
ncbi:serine hydrolase domain-containing protein [Virgisporangium aurantiacum]|uniref:Penicillin-binding protein n=1 Tax=Virgisporangium aurantiacum TaxID=175570 RepID=A0A8J3ZFM3_9ACTN|nr:serine hydrolase domain-containing protein [Virgisporangium aurantiacum]GIJ60710.1 penicillin-binding protein [Virgisporangium aurantiacum]